MRLLSKALMATVLATGVVFAQVAPDPQPDTIRPDRGVARISVINGDVSILRGDSGERIAAALNAPLVVGDRLATGPGARAEIQFDSANMIRIAPDSEVRIPELEVDRFQVQIGRGTVLYRVLRESHSQAEVSTPNSSIRPSIIGAYRISVSEDGQTEITVRLGEVDVYTPQGAEKVRVGQTMQVRGDPADPEYQILRSGPADDWDHWNERRDSELSRSASVRHVSPDIYGAEDLDGHGRWLNDPAYGQVWSPNEPAGWAPYQAGRWVWVDWYGWTWVSDDPWGWAPYHYGRWYMGSAGWCWVPGPVYAHQYWSPGLVAFFGFGGAGVGIDVGFGFGGLGWVPLAPYERYHPWYGRGIYGGYRNAAVFANSANIIHNTNLGGMYRNARVAGAVTGVSSQDFAHGRFNNRMRVSSAQIQQAGLVRGAVPMAPQRENLRLTDRAPSSAARISSNEGRFYSRSRVPSVNRVPFEQQRQSLQQAGAAAARQSSPAPTTGGWRRTAPGSMPMPEARSASPAAIAPPRSIAPQSAPSIGGWRRFGEPSRQVPNTIYGTRTTTPSPAARSVEPSLNSRPSASGFGQSTPRSFGYGASPYRSLQVSPPVVRQRPTPSAPSPAPSAGRASSPPRAPASSSHSRPSGGHSGGGGGHSGGGGGRSGGRGR